MAIQHLGTNAVPWLIQMQNARDTAFNLAFQRLCEQQSLVDIQLITADDRRHAAMNCLAVLGPNAKAAFPNLVQLINDRDSYEAAITLFRIGTDSIPTLEATASTNMTMQAYCWDMLGQLHDDTIFSNLLAAVKDPDPSVYGWAAEGLTGFPEKSEIVIPALIANLSHPFPAVRRAATFALGHFGERAKAAVPGILQVLEADKSSPMP